MISRRTTIVTSPARRGLLRNGLRRPQPGGKNDKNKGGSGPSQALKVIASVAANLTLLTALLYYFGYLYTQKFFSYFHVHYTLLGQTTDEILARGVDGMLVPFAAAAGTGLLLFGLFRVARFLLPEPVWATALRISTPIAVVTGLALIGIVIPVVGNPEPFRDHPGLPGLALALGVVLVVTGWRRLVPGRHGSTFLITEWIITYLLATVALFWAVADYSARVGLREAYNHAARIPALPAVVLYSARSLNLEADGVRQVVCAQTDAAYKHRYSGLKLLLQSGGQYVFVPTNWRASTGVSFVIPRTDSLRLEFGPPMAVPGRTC
nr:hypothetical protein [Kibdelosporangium sp. MJ126-NF4]CEL21227.1 hypothetical protein [Kibdelosporangium sp. MJ126-NF4]CTQ96206.1 hypothetical protein [Kibdelosporangium sp. MJ126-NF4]